MIILPAIDMIDGKPVRLYQGDYNQKEVVAESVLDTAKSFAEIGASYIHMVDLDGAKSGKKDNAKVIVEVAKNISVPIEVGGGIRSEEDIAFYLENGISRVILGTAALRDFSFLTEMVKKYGSQIAVGLDCKDGYAMATGWLEKSEYYYTDFAKQLEKIGVKNIIFTDISKDGTLSGPNLQQLQTLKNATSIDITASGGIHTLQDIKDLKQMDLYGAITGKAIYAGTLDLAQAIQVGEV